MKHCVLILQLSHLCIFDLMISKLQFNLKFNHPSNIFFLQLGSNFLSTILTEYHCKTCSEISYYFLIQALASAVPNLLLYLCLLGFVFVFSIKIPPLSKLHLTIVSLKMHSEVLCQNPNLLFYLYLLLHLFIFSFFKEGSSQK